MGFSNKFLNFEKNFRKKVFWKENFLSPLFCIFSSKFSSINPIDFSYKVNICYYFSELLKIYKSLFNEEIKNEKIGFLDVLKKNIFPYLSAFSLGLYLKDDIAQESIEDIFAAIRKNCQKSLKLFSFCINT